nr:histidinol-phosphate aminotransferase, chloroplastic [Ipomoea batatas]
MGVIDFCNSSSICIGRPRPSRGIEANWRGRIAVMASSSVPVKEESQPRQVVDGASFIRPHLRTLKPYQPILPFEVLSARLGRKPEDIIKLDANENPYGPPPEVLEALGAIEFPYIYPDPESRRLRAALSEDSGLESEYILAGCGADELIDLIMRCVLDPGDKIVDCPPTFTMYEFDAAVNGALVIKGCLSSLQNVKVALVQERERLYNLLKEVPFLDPYPSHSNFILCKVASTMDAKKLKEDLALMGVMIRHYDNKELRGFVRVSVGKPEHTDALMKGLKHFY